jgi:AraC-like DNA-binding protein
LFVTLVVLIATSALGLVMTVYLLGLASRMGYFSACGILALAFLLISVSSALLGVHLIHDIALLLRIRGALALVIIPCLYLYFVAAGTQGHALPKTTPWHGLWLLGSLGAMATNMAFLLDYILIAELIFYIAALALIWRDRDRAFANLKEDGGKTVWWLGIIIVFLSISMVLEIFILVDLSGGGLLQASMPLLLSLLSLVVLVSISLIGALGRPSLFEHLYSLAVDSRLNGSPSDQSPPDPEERELVDRALELLGDPDVLADPSLTITRLSRKLGVPARQLSRAINRVRRCSFSDLLNDQRIQLCKTIMLDDPGRPLLDVMLDAGYASKSNFYTQFVRRTGVAPAAFRTVMSLGGGLEVADDS